jgi:U3 small nucleolar RNA-associated protein 14
LREDGEGDSENDEVVGRLKFGTRKQKELPQPLVSIQKSEFEERESDAEFDNGEDGEEESGAVVHKTSSSIVPVKNGTSNPLQASAPVKSGKAATNGAFKSGGEKTKTRPPASKTTAIPKKQTKISQTNLDDYTSPSESEGESEQDTKSALANAIFAGLDDVEQDFAKEKKEVEEEEGDQVVDNSLPGWGNWAGEGISKKAQKRAKGRFLTTIKGVAKDKRQDAKLDRVIINEKKQVKKHGKYLATELPHPFESRQQYERSLRLPLGPEWTTKSTFQDATKPRVLMKQGIIRPMTRPLV